MKSNSKNQIYARNFKDLYNHRISLIWESSINTKTNIEEDMLFLPSKHLFDFGNKKFNRIKVLK